MGYQNKILEMKLLALFSLVNGSFLSGSLPADLSKDFYRSAQLRADQLFRDAIAEHRDKVKDTDLRNPGHMEAAFRKNVTNYLENLIGEDTSISDELVTDGRWKVKVTRFTPSTSKSSGAIVYAHGGGYVAGSVKLNSRFLTWLAETTGTTVFAPQYRMAPRRMWPGQFDEVMETISYVYDNAKELLVDNSKIVVAGEGSGATAIYAASLQLASNGRKIDEEYVTMPLSGVVLLQPFTQWINFDTPSYRKFNTLTLRKSDIGYSMSALFGGERDYDLIDAIEYGHVIDVTMKDSLEVKAVNPMKWLSKSTLGDFEPDSLNYDATEHQWEKKLKNRISNGSVSPLSVMDRMLKALPKVSIVANERDIVHDDAEMLYNRLKSISGVSPKLDVTPRAMHNNFAWSSYFSGIDLLKLGDEQCQVFAKRISQYLNNHDEL